MAFDKPTRNKLARMVGECRRLLTDDIRDQLQAVYGIQADGTALAVDKLAHLDDRERKTAIALRHWLGHLAVSETGSGIERRRKAFSRMAHETAFTYLNRLAALRMCEERGHVIECVRRGMESDGFAMYERLAGQALGDRGATYRVFLECTFDELAVDLGVLFDRRAPHSLVFPRPACIEAVLGELNAAELAHLWREDETIGWVYQDFNDERERRRMRDESPSPRNTRELAVRNQFFTPRYVVEFLTDNTLGRIWYEMRQGDTQLTEDCRYLVRRPSEVFLAPGEEPPPPEKSDEDLSQEELLKRPVHIPHRPKKDPRDLKILDPACGSGHFLLYAFDLLETIYIEAFHDHDLPLPLGEGRGEGMRALREDYASEADLRKAIPALVLRHNLHGIDIDPRAVQIAALALWLRAQRSYQNLGLKPADRPPITKSNIVCAEPMPAEADFLNEFADALRPPILGQLVRSIFQTMELAAEAGSLLKIEEEIRGSLVEARKKWEAQSERARDKKGRDLLFTVGEMERIAKDSQPMLDLSGITDDEFWVEAEPRILAELKRYAASAGNGKAVQRHLFAEDAEQGFAFVDLCRQRYDVVLMNPPFGDASLPSKPYVDNTYDDTKGDVYRAFVECFQSRLVPAGYLGIISSRTGFFLGQSEDWRVRVVLRLFRPITLADLGSGVLDAMVEVAAYVLRSLSAQEARDLTLSLVPVLKKVARDKHDGFSLPKWQAARDGLKRHQAVSELEHLEAAGFVQRCPGEIVRYTPLWHAVKTVAVPTEPIFPPLVCFRALAEDDKSEMLAAAVRGSAQDTTFVCDPAGFSQVPGSPFAYWVGRKTLSLFLSLPSLQGDGREAVFGGSSKDDFRYLRLAWEFLPGRIARTRGETSEGRVWVSFAKGGTFSHYYSDLYLAIQWRNDGREIKQSISEYRGSRGWGYQWTAALNGHSQYFRCGLTWPRRTNGLSFRVLPSGCIFGDKGPALFVEHNISGRLLAINAVISSLPFRGLVALQLARVELAQSFEVGLIQQTPFPHLSADVEETLANFARRAWREKRNVDSAGATSHAFVLPALLAASGARLAERATAWAAAVRTSEETVAAIQAEIDDIAFRLYGLDAADHAALTASLVIQSSGGSAADASSGRADQEEEAMFVADAPALVADLLAYALGAAFGRWDLRLATGACPVPPEPDPFDPLPVCPAGMLVGPDGLPAKPNRIVSDDWLRARPDTNTVPPQARSRTRPYLTPAIRSVSPGTVFWWTTRVSTVDNPTGTTSAAASANSWSCFGGTRPTRSSKRPAISSAFPTCAPTSAGLRDSSRTI